MATSQPLLDRRSGDAHGRTSRPSAPTTTPSAAATAVAPAWSAKGLALSALRVLIGFEFLWAFVDKMFGFGYSTTHAKAWINGGSPTKGFLSHVSGGPLESFYHSLVDVPGINLLFMAALLGIGTALILGVAIRPAVASGVLLLMMMWFASWPLDKTSNGAPSGSTNPLVDDHIISSAALIVVALFAASSVSYLGRRWGRLTLVRRQPWLR